MVLNMINKYSSSNSAIILKYWGILFFFMFAFSIISLGQAVGDYRTNSTGAAWNWNTVANWQRCVTAGTWAGATSTTYPGQNPGAGTVTILNNTNVTLNITPANSIGSLVLQTGNRASSLSFNGTNSLVVTGSTTIEIPTSTDVTRYKYIRVLAGSMTTSSVTINASTDDGRDSYIEISSGSLNIGGSLTMLGSNLRNYILFSGAGTLNVGGTITGGTITSVLGGGASAPTSGTVNYNNAVAQNIGAYTYYNLTTSNGGTKTLSGNTFVSNNLTLNSGAIQLGDYNLALTSTASNAIQGASFDVTNSVETNGLGYLIRPAATTLPIAFPIASDGHYSPVSISSISGGTTGDINARTEADNTLGSNYLPRIWDLITSTTGKTLTTLFTYDAAETSITPTNIWVKPTAGSWQAPTGTSSFGANSFTITSTTDVTNTLTSWTAGLLPDTYFSYQTGNWDQPSTWTSDPGGTTQVGTTVPSDGDVVVILPNRTVTLTNNVATANLEININSAGILNLSTYAFTSGLSALKGTGTLQLASTSFPSATTNTFINAGGGTTEYKNAADFTFAQQTYNNLTINTSVGVIATQLSDITLNGNLLVKQGTFRINDNTAGTKLNLTINGNVTVNSGAFIKVGNGSTNTTTTPTGISGGTAPFLNYYEHFHRVIIKGNFTNNGTIKFTNLTAPFYDAFPPLGDLATSGAASVYFQGATNNTMLCNGITDFYNLILDKGVDQTFQLAIQPSDFGNFRLFGANNAATTVSANPDLMKALWIRNGSLVLRGLTVLPSLTEGTVAGSEYYIPSNGALVIEGPEVIVMNTADDYEEVRIAYGVPAGTGVNTAGAAYQGLVVFGKLRVDNGYLSTRESAGLLYSSPASGEFNLNGGIIDAKQFRTYDGIAIGAAYRQTGGVFILRGRFVRPVAYASISDLSNTAITFSARAVNGTNDTYGTFNLEFDENIFSMSGGTIRLYDASGVNGIQKIVDVGSTLANSSVTGGTIEVLPQTGTVLADFTKLEIYSKESVLGNLVINRGVGCATYVRLRARPLAILQNFTLTSGDFRTNGQNITIGRNLTVSTNGTYNANANTTFNGTNKQIFTIDGTINNGAVGLANLVIDRTTDSLKLAGSQTSLIVQGTFDLNGGVFVDGGKTVSVAGNITNYGTHSGTGEIQLNGTAPQTIGGSNSSIFQNLNLNNTNAAAAPISLTTNTTINGVLTFSLDKLFYINTYNINFSSNASVVNAGTNRYIQTNGDAGDGGVTKVYASSAAFNFPFGVTNYTPASIGFGVDPTVYGSITIKPINYQHPNVTTSGRSLTYFWRVKSSGFTMGSGTVNHSYTYSTSNVVEAGVDPLETGYVAARYDPVNFTWTRGTSSDVDESNNIIGEPGTGTFLENVNFINGDYTAGDDNPTNPFGTPTKYYSRQSGEWGTTTTWSLTSHTADNVPATAPNADDIVIIGNGHTVTFETPANYLTNRNTSPHYCASLLVEAGATLDTRFNPASTFSMVQSHPNGNGTIRVAADETDGSTFEFPLGDFSDFNENLGTTEFYSTNPATSTTYWLPNNVNKYGNLIISPRGSSNIIFGNTSILVYGNCITRGDNPDSWFLPTWSGNYPGAIARISKTITIMGDLDLQGGSFGWNGGGGGGAQNLIVYGNVTVSDIAGIDVWSSNTSQTMAIGGSLINNTTGAPVPFTSSTNHCDFSLLPLTFFGNNSATISNTSGTPATIFSTVLVNKGTTQTTTLTLDIDGTLTTPTDNWLTLQNGTFKYMRTDPSTDFTISVNTPFSIAKTAGLYVDYTSAVTRNILIANTTNPAQGDASDVFLDGKLSIINGNVYIGPTNGAGARNNDIEYSGSGASEIDIQGGSLMVNGQIRRDPSSSASILKYSQSGGSLTINGQNANTTNAKLEVCNFGSTFNMSGGTITIVRGGGGTTYGDLYLRPETSTVTGGTINLQPVTGISAAQEIFTIDANIALNDLNINGFAATDAARASISINPLVLNGDLIFSNGNSYLTANNLNVTIKGDLTNNGTAASYIYGTNTTIFNGNTQQLNGSSATNFYNLTVNPLTSLTLNNGNNLTINNNLTLSSGTLICGNFSANVKNNFTNNAAYTDNLYGVIMNGTVGEQIVSGTGNFARLEINNPYGVKTTTDITLSKDLVLTKGILNINSHLLSLGQSSSIGGSGFGATKMITSNGVFSDKGISKVFGIGAGTFTYPLGVSGKYTPAILTIGTNPAVGSIRVNNINDNHPGVIDPANVLQYYWEVESSAISGFTGNFVFNYLDGDVMGGPETSYLAARIEIPGVTWSLASNVAPVANTITFYYTGSNNLSGEYTAGVDPAFPDEIPVFTSVANGNWNTPATWVQTAGDPYTLTSGPNGFIVIINDTITADANYCQSYRTTINGELKIVSPFFGHNLGTVDGTGRLHLESGTFPAGRFTSFLACSNNSTIEYGGIGNYPLIADLYDEIPNLIISGTGSRVLPNKDLTICNLLEINGPTLDNSVNNSKLFIKNRMELLTGAFNAGTDNATVSFSGTAAQVIRDFNGTNSFNNLEINNSLGLTLNSTIDVGGTLLLTNGLITSTAANILRVTNPIVNCVIPAGGSDASYVSGPMIKKINQGDTYFKFPIGNATTPGNKLSIRATQIGPQFWTVDYINPSSYNSYSSPLSAVNDIEYWNVSTPGGGNAFINVEWNSSSNLTPLMTQNGIDDMRVAEHNGTNWIEIPSAALVGSNDYTGSAETSNRVSVPAGGSKNYTLGCVNTTKPRIRLAPTGPICGNAGIPIALSVSYPIFGTFTINYTKNGVAKTAITPAGFPATLPTDTDYGEYQLTSFTYYQPAGTLKTGVVDATKVTVYAVPTTSDAGDLQSLCGATTTTLDANTPTVGTGVWSIISGSGGFVAEPTNPISSFTGTNGSSYTLRWTISNGTCTSISDVSISFPLLPAQPLSFTASPNPVCQGDQDIIYTVPLDPLISTYNWSYTGTSVLFSSTTNSVELDYGITATGGTLSVTATNGCGTSAARSVVIVVKEAPTAALSFGAGTGNICDGDNPEITVTLTGGTSPYSFDIFNGSATETITGATSPYLFTPSVPNTPVWVGLGTNTKYTYSIPTITSANGCSNVGSNTVDVYVWTPPETGPQYHISNGFGY